MSFKPVQKPVDASPGNAQSLPFDPGAAVRRLAGTIDNPYAGTSWGAQSQAPHDIHLHAVGYKTGFQDTGRVVTGIVVDGTPIANCYKVFLEKARAPIIAMATATTSQSAYGASAFCGYTPGTPVIVMVHDKQAQAVILGAAPIVLDVGVRAYHDYISQASRKRVDDCHKKYLKQPINGQMVDWSAWRPWDGTMGGEWGAMSTTGIAVSVDDFMLRASVNEFCGLYGFYHDSLLRMVGYNMQVWTAGSERDAFMDQGECNDTQGYSPYPWEAMGKLQPTTIITEYESKDYQCALAKPWYAHWENNNEFQQPYHRTQNFFGYLGQGARKVVHAPPPGLQEWTYKPGKSGSPTPPYDSQVVDGEPPECGGGPSKTNNHEEKPVYGLYEENTALDGRHFMTSAKGIVIAKRILLPIPQRLKRPDSGEGDDAEKNYKAASKFGSGPNHDITGDIKETDEKWPNLQRATAVLDLHGYLFNYAGLHPFYWHEKDYKTWEEQDLAQNGPTSNQKPPQFGMLGSQMYLKQPAPKQFQIDHRYNTQKFYETESFVSLLEDGSIVIGDGYGAEIRMSGGCMFLSAPGDVWCQAGRDVQLWGGNDVSVKGYKSVDVVATEKNVRIKAERNVLVLAGNDSSDREGGILLESRGNTTDYDFEKCGDKIKFAGIVMRAPKSNVVSLAHQIYLRTGGGDIKPGDIVIDAATGSNDIVTKSNNLYNYLKKAGTVCHFFGGQKVGGTNKANFFSQYITTLCGPLGIDKDIFINGNVLCDGSVLVSKGHILTEAAAKGAIFVGPCDGTCQGQVKEAVQQFRKLIDTEIPKVGNTIDQSKLQQLWYAAKKAGNDETIPILEFSFRLDEDYNIEDFRLYESRWQQMGRLIDSVPEQWNERKVRNKKCEETWAYPGKKWWEQEPSFVEQDLKIVTPADGYIDKKRNPAPGLATEYKQPEFKPNSPQTLQGVYGIIPRQGG